jgi:hypothetical protein
MFSRRPQPIAEHEAKGDTARIYHEIRQTLRVSGVNLNFRTWAGYPTFFPAMWAAMQPLAASEAFESASSELRAHAAELARTLPALEINAPVGESQRFHIARALALYHYINPKLLLFTVIVRRALQGKPATDVAIPSVDLGRKVPSGRRRPWPRPRRASKSNSPGSPPTCTRIRGGFTSIPPGTWSI